MRISEIEDHNAVLLTLHNIPLAEDFDKILMAALEIKQLMKVYDRTTKRMLLPNLNKLKDKVDVFFL